MQYIRYSCSENDRLFIRSFILCPDLKAPETEALTGFHRPSGCLVGGTWLYFTLLVFLLVKWCVYHCRVVHRGIPRGCCSRVNAVVMQLSSSLRKFRTADPERNEVVNNPYARPYTDAAWREKMYEINLVCRLTVDLETRVAVGPDRYWV